MTVLFACLVEAYVGKLYPRGGKVTLVQWPYADGKNEQASDACLKACRPAQAMK
ncbi:MULTISPECIES: hypothetical protein [unclassified Limnohabitans]|uniref:hypothetical protein n=1 Tax=unclassified Limnohabitans TaxID=2626134 RepID=UPI000A45C47F|nr:MULTISPECIES: hypothetical protein [unclassified Limnohabitans]